MLKPTRKIEYTNFKGNLRKDILEKFTAYAEFRGFEELDEAIAAAMEYAMSKDTEYKKSQMKSKKFVAEPA